MELYLRFFICLNSLHKADFIFRYWSNIFKQIGTSIPHRSVDERTKSIIGKRRWKYHFGGQGVDKRIILNESEGGGEKVVRKWSWLRCFSIGSSSRLMPMIVWNFGFHKYGWFSSPKWENAVPFRNDCSIATNRVTVLNSRDGIFSTSVQTSRHACNFHHDLHIAVYYSVSGTSLYSTHGRHVTGHITVSSRQKHAAVDASLDNMNWWTTCRWL